ncbi:acyl-homoserine-lactone synthase [Pseudosulfitobacter pseudonitzschiae]|uniref:Acyl-homoserine-lactone synthase n=1 Tax=Pseudosulfitobacter pseudonitzschiae TaxID=1402135 RepID=A0A073J195_9RHOB|nr:acyl-homoserine-lactone synthase [Pseudosulfitobacter pseudonitzschiae]KEJ95456.1 autoinducer synthase [Pseudosulfitobacter pseudonitzschiae]MBM1816094.1 autoinducer synthase [Pseudosulfitobacter pseudonitzschiae]MBM1833400.1 autoinducer synthase [Pseudosulfitobacter pseudonitzschiae]MBM1838267.1 autoinducer synthase [Pseudosulfitobacter pseudonitzschiae]MBM1842799.1 autoinducer synthase [Pseudosulfitobacter pseudonitzschiae]
MIIVIDGLNRQRYSRLLDEMFALRARVFGQRLGWEVDIVNGKEIDQFDALDPAYVIGLNDEGHVVSCVRALQTTGPHMLSDVFHDILDGEPPLRSATLWESTRFCVDTDILDRGNSRNSVSYATCELMAASLEYAKNSGISDIVTVIDPVMNRVLKRSDCAPYGYVGSTKPMGKVSAMAALLDCSDERIAKIRAFAGIEGDMFVSDQRAYELSDDHRPTVAAPNIAKVTDDARMRQLLQEYCDDQIADAATLEDLDAAKDLARMLEDANMIDARNSSGTHG